ncbi:UNVERIFIED_CONTAM: hypothetical protein Slati_1106900 [Sesamum latifolium]|uniref:Zinc knuckle CX2CX4HX4C domain-containing protein n=1 Tax=Sesamum latifolium TaxID=2727402 RepID=A0AAW2XBC8_9LAMI
MGSLESVTSKLKQALQLGDKDVEEAVIPDGLWRAGSSNDHLCLVGRLLSKKAFNFEGMSASIRSMIMPVKGMEIKQVNIDRFLFRFNHVIDRNRALEGCPWSFEKNILVLSGIGENENPLHVDLSWCDFHIHVHDLPLSRMNLGIATYIGNKIGKLRDIDMDATGTAWGATLRIRATINVNLPLPRALNLKTTMGEEHLVTFTYERLPNFCYLCGCLGHITKYYLKHYEEGFQDPGSNTLYGPWLRAPLPNWVRSGVSATISSPRQLSSNTTHKGAIRKGPKIFGNFSHRVQDGSPKQHQVNSTASERVAESECQGRGVAIGEQPDMCMDTDSAIESGRTNLVGGVAKQITLIDQSLIFAADIGQQPCNSDNMETVQIHLSLMEAELVNVPLSFAAGARGRRGSARRGQRVSFKNRTTSRKREQGINIIEHVLGASHTLKKRAKLVDEESNSILAETAEQYCRAL